MSYQIPYEKLPESALKKAVKKGDVETVKILIKNGVNLNEDKEQRTHCRDLASSEQYEYVYSNLFQIASKNGDFEMAKLLLDNGVNYSDRYINKNGSMDGDCYYQSNPRIVEYLIDNFKINSDIKKSMCISYSKGVINPFRIREVIDYTDSVEVVKCIVKKFPEILTEVYENTNMDVIKYLKENGSFNKHIFSYMTRLYGDKLEKGLPITFYKDDIKFLIDNGADINQKNGSRDTNILTICIMCRDFELFKYLIESGADLNITIWHQSSFTNKDLIQSIGDERFITYIDSSDKSLYKKSLKDKLLQANLDGNIDEIKELDKKIEKYPDLLNNSVTARGDVVSHN